jgi:hypothetical protein
VYNVVYQSSKHPIVENIARVVGRNIVENTKQKNKEYIESVILWTVRKSCKPA